MIFKYGPVLLQTNKVERLAEKSNPYPTEIGDITLNETGFAGFATLYKVI